VSLNDTLETGFQQTVLPIEALQLVRCKAQATRFDIGTAIYGYP
jgi:hypothetical protein